MDIYTFEEESRGSNIHFVISEHGNSEPIGFIRVTAERAYEVRHALSSFNKRAMEIRAAESPLITSG